MITMEDIRKFTLFRDLPTETLAAIIPRLISNAFSANTTIIYRGDPGHSMFMILSGSAAATLINYEGIEYTLSTMTEGDIFGEIALLTGEPRTANVKAVPDVRVIELSRDIFDELRKRYGVRPKQALHVHKDYPLENDEREVCGCQPVYQPTKVIFDIDGHVKEVREIHKKQ